MTVEYISIENYIELWESMLDDMNLALSLVCFDGHLYRVDIYTRGCTQLVPDTGLMRVLI